MTVTAAGERSTGIAFCTVKKIDFTLNAIRAS
jgi:hypothetical protein